MSITVTLAYHRQETIRALFQEYTQMLVALDPTFAKYLILQNYDAELEHLEGKYGLPDGRLYLAQADGRAAGCIALRKLDDQRCEMKRLYVRPEFRGMGLGKTLALQIISDARQIGYRTMLLDTLPCLTNAVRLYHSLGFRDTECYNNSPVNDTIFMELPLAE